MGKNVVGKNDFWGKMSQSRISWKKMGKNVFWGKMSWGKTSFGVKCLSQKYCKKKWGKMTFGEKCHREKCLAPVYTVVAKKDKTTLLETIHFNCDIFENCVPQLILPFCHLARFFIFPA